MIANLLADGCVFDANALSNTGLIQSLFTGGLALYGAGTIAAVYVFVAVAAWIKSEKFRSSESKAMPPASVFIKSGLAGFSFGTEIFLIMALSVDAQGIAFPMLCFRLLHFFGTIILMIFLFGNSGTVRWLSCLLNEGPRLRSLLNEELFIGILPLQAVTLILCLGDMSMLQFLAWEKSEFYVLSQGYPSHGLMVFVLIVDTIQPTATTICQIIYLCASASVSDPTTSKQAKALFIGNILVSVTTVILSVIMLVAKRKIFKGVDAQIKLREGQAAELAETFGDIYSPDGSSSHDAGQSRDPEQNMSFTTNPLQMGEGVGANPPRSAEIEEGFRLQRRAFIELSETISNSINASTREILGALNISHATTAAFERVETREEEEEKDNHQMENKESRGICL